MHRPADAFPTLINVYHFSLILLGIQCVYHKCHTEGSDILKNIALPCMWKQLNGSGNISSTNCHQKDNTQFDFNVSVSKQSLKFGLDTNLPSGNTEAVIRQPSNTYQNQFSEIPEIRHFHLYTVCVNASLFDTLGKSTDSSYLNIFLSRYTLEGTDIGLCGLIHEASPWDVFLILVKPAAWVFTIIENVGSH